MQQIAFGILQLTVVVEIKVASAAVVHLLAVLLAKLEKAVAVNGKVGDRVGGFKRPLRIVAKYGIGAHALADLGCAADAATVCVQIV